MFCPNCGAEIPEGNSFCEQCGEKVSREDTNNIEKDKTEYLDGAVPYNGEPTTDGQGIIVPDIDLIPEEELMVESSGRSPKIIVIALLILALVSAGVGFGITKILNNDDGGDSKATEATESSETDESAGSEEEEYDEEAEAASHVIAGRGTAGRYDDLDGMEKWVEDGARLIEQDVCMSLDGTLYVSHEPGNVEGFYDHDINALKLEKVFDRFEDDDVIFVVELKSTTGAAATVFSDLVEEYGYGDRVIAQSFDAGVLKAVRGRLPDTETMYLISNNSISRGQPTLDQALGYDHIDIIAVNEHTDGMMTGKNCDKVHDAGKEFGAFILSDEKMVREAIDIGVDYYFIGETNMTPSTAIHLEENRYD